MDALPGALALPDSAALAAAEAAATWCALVTADSSPLGLGDAAPELGLGDAPPLGLGDAPPLESLGFSASVHSAKNARVATSSATSGRGTLAIKPASARPVRNLSNGRAGRRRYGPHASRKPSSRSCSGSTGAGAPVSGSAPEADFGNAITSRIDSTPASAATIRSIPIAMPPWGGAP